MRHAGLIGQYCTRQSRVLYCNLTPPGSCAVLDARALVCCEVFGFERNVEMLHVDSFI